MKRMKGRRGVGSGVRLVEIPHGIVSFPFVSSFEALFIVYSHANGHSSPRLITPLGTKAKVEFKQIALRTRLRMSPRERSS